MSFIACDEAQGLVKKARTNLSNAQTIMLKLAGWQPSVSAYDLRTSWYHPKVGLISKETAVCLAMKEMEL